MKKINIYTPLLIILCAPFCFSKSAQINNEGIKNIINRLLVAYQTKNFSPLLIYSQGNYKEFVQRMTDYQVKNNTSHPALKQMADHLKKLEVLDQKIEDNSATILIGWELSYNKPKPYIKIIKEEYNLLLDNNQWKIERSQKKGENYLKVH